MSDDNLFNREGSTHVTIQSTKTPNYNNKLCKTEHISTLIIEHTEHSHEKGIVLVADIFILIIGSIKVTRHTYYPNNSRASTIEMTFDLSGRAVANKACNFAMFPPLRSRYSHFPLPALNSGS